MCSPRTEEMFSRWCCSCSDTSFALSRARACCLFWSWERSLWQVITRPVGLCVRRTAESAVLTDWPPAPEERKTSHSMSSSLISTSSSGIWGVTSTSANEVSRVDFWAKGEMRTRRWTPFSCFK